MTQRPRSHQLETVSRLAFAAALPTSWVVRDSHPDYGIDGVVEVFSGDGEATGHQFLYQIKATDRVVLTEALAVQFGRRHLDYYAALLLPVLLVVYHAPTALLYVRWIDDDPDIMPPKSASITVRMAEADRLTELRIAEICQKLKAVRAAAKIGDRAVRIKRYYDRIRTGDTDTQSANPIRSPQWINTGDRIFHAVFGVGILEQQSDDWFLARFEQDGVSRKFYSGALWEFARCSAED